MQGKVKNVFRDREFGFIIPDDGGADVYFHRSNVQPDTFARLAPGQKVTFEVKTGNRGKQEAFNLVIESAQNSPQPMVLEASVASIAPNIAGTEVEQLAPPPGRGGEPPPLPSKEKSQETDTGEDAEENTETIQRSKWGTVKRFDREKGTGFIVPKEGGADVFVFHRNITGRGFKTLFPNEPVLYDIGTDERGRPWAINVRPAPVPVRNGKLVRFDEDQGRGQIQPNEGGEPISFDADGVQDKDLSEYEEGDLVKYRVVESGAKPVAVRVTRLEDPRLPLERFADLAEFDRLLDRLANPRYGAAHEEWNYRIRPSEYPYPILANYLQYTFKRIEQQGKIIFGKNRFGEDVACFNTGLATVGQEELFAFFTRAKRRRTIIVSKSTLAAPEWVLEGFFKSSDGPMLDMPRMPEIATYFEPDGLKNLVFDLTLDFRIRKDHILRDRRERFLALPNLPDSLRNDPEALADRFETALGLAKRRVRRNYKTAIPTFNRGKINLLLPLTIVSKEKADLALLVERKSDYEGKTDFYIGWTVLTLDMAYNNARLLARPDTEWLTP